MAVTHTYDEGDRAQNVEAKADELRVGNEAFPEPELALEVEPNTPEAGQSEAWRRGESEDIVIDEEFQRLISSLNDGERVGLKESLLAEGRCRDALMVWKGHGILLDGHHRYAICREHPHIEYRVEYRECADREAAKAWIVENQLGRRNLNRFQRVELALQVEPIFAAEAKRNQGTRTDLLRRSVNRVNTQARLADLAGASHDMIHKVKAIKREASEETLEKLRREEISVNAAYESLKRKKSETEKKRRSKAPSAMSEVVETRAEGYDEGAVLDARSPIDATPAASKPAKGVEDAGIALEAVEDHEADGGDVGNVAAATGSADAEEAAPAADNPEADGGLRSPGGDLPWTEPLSAPRAGREAWGPAGSGVDPNVQERAEQEATRLAEESDLSPIERAQLCQLLAHWIAFSGYWWEQRCTRKAQEIFLGWLRRRMK